MSDPTTPRPPTCYETLNKLRALLTAATEQPWHALVMMNPVFEDQADSPFLVKLRATKEFIGQYEADQSPEQLTAIVGDVLAIWRSNQAETQAAPPLLDEDGNVAYDPRVAGKLVKLTLANGKAIEVVSRIATPRESERTEDARIAHDLATAIDVDVDWGGEEPTVIVYNGVQQILYPGPNVVKKPFADVLRTHREEPNPLLDLETRRRKLGMAAGFATYEDVESFLSRSTRG